MITNLYVYFMFIAAMLVVLAVILKLAFREYRAYKNALKVSSAVFDFCEYFEKTQRMVASIPDGKGKRKTITGKAKFDESGRCFAIYTDDSGVLPPSVLSARTIAAIEGKEALSRKGGVL